jgi:flagellar hook-associated protein 2
VVSEKSGKESRINIDPDTTFLEFKEQVTGQNLDVLFEDVPVTNDRNQLDELIAGVTFNVKRAEPGTRVQVNIVHDIDTTVTGIKDFVDKYNAVSQFVNEQSRFDQETKTAGLLGGDSSVRTVMRSLQSALQTMGQETGKFRTLADVGITTNAKTGELQMDEAKVRAALTEDYESVAQLFTQSRSGTGVAAKMAEAIKMVRDPGSGALRSRIRGLDTVIQSQDRAIERRERQLGQREETIRRRFSNLESQMAGLQQQGQFLAARFGGGDGGQAAPAGGGG